MDPNVARMVVAGITAVGVIVWLAGLRFLIASRRKRYQPLDRDGGVDKIAEDGWLSGTADIEGQAGELSQRAAQLLAAGSLGPVAVLDRADDRIRFERVRGMNTPGPWFRRGELRFQSSGSEYSRVSWLVEPSASQWLLWLGAAFQVLGLIALVVGSWAAYTFLASSTEPAARWQSFQMLQACHFLWPPFLFGALYRTGFRTLAGQCDALVHNLPFAGEPTTSR